jgi:hypothetical protein
MFEETINNLFCYLNSMKFIYSYFFLMTYNNVKISLIITQPSLTQLDKHFSVLLLEFRLKTRKRKNNQSIPMYVILFNFSTEILNEF